MIGSLRRTRSIQRRTSWSLNRTIDSLRRTRSTLSVMRSTQRRTTGTLNRTIGSPGRTNEAFEGDIREESIRELYELTRTDRRMAHSRKLA
jgi:hypothetical protein